MVLDWKRTCAIWQGRKRVGSIAAEEIQGEGYCATCAVRFVIWRFGTPDVLGCDKDREPMALVLYVLRDSAAPPKWAVLGHDHPWPFILARLCAQHAVDSAAPHVKVRCEGSVADKFVGRDIFGKDSPQPFTVAQDETLVFAGQDRGQVEYECYVDILCTLDEADRDRRVQAPGDANGLLESGMLGNFYQPREVSRALQEAVDSRMVRKDASLAITEAGRAELRRLDQEGFERRLAPRLPSQKPRIGFGG